MHRSKCDKNKCIINHINISNISININNKSKTNKNKSNIKINLMIIKIRTYLNNFKCKPNKNNSINKIHYNNNNKNK